MSREVIIKAWCDNTAAHSDTKVESDSTLVLTVGAQPPSELDLCAECEGALYTPLAKVLADAGRAPTDVGPPRVRVGGHPQKAAKNVEQWTCPECHEDMNISSGLGHVWRKHLAGVDRPEQPTECPECGQHFPRAASMGMHRATKHRWNPRDEALAIVAARRGSKRA
jgi:hypothetical protein